MSPEDAMQARYDQYDDAVRADVGDLLGEAREALANMMMLRRFSTRQGQREMVDHAIATLAKLDATRPPHGGKA